MSIHKNAVEFDGSVCCYFCGQIWHPHKGQGEPSKCNERLTDAERLSRENAALKRDLEAARAKLAEEDAAVLALMRLRDSLKAELERERAGAAAYKAEVCATVCAVAQDGGHHPLCGQDGRAEAERIKRLEAVVEAARDLEEKRSIGASVYIVQKAILALQAALAALDKEPT